MIYPTLEEVLRLHQSVIARFGGSPELLNRGLLESALAKPQATFGGQELYPSLIEKAAALGFSLIKNHAFCDGNKRVGYSTMEAFLVINDYEITSDLDEAECVTLAVASGSMTQAELVEWLIAHTHPFGE